MIRGIISPKVFLGAVFAFFWVAAAATLWGHVPAYLQRSPRVVYKLITILNKAVGMKCPVQILRQQSIELDRKISEALAKDPGLRQFVESIEEKRSQKEPSSSDDKIIHMNDFLRRDPKKDPEAEKND